MAVTISTPQFSPIQFTQTDWLSCADNPGQCLPVYSMAETDLITDRADIGFQFFIAADGVDLAGLIAGISDPHADMTKDIWFYLVPGGSDCDIASINEDQTILIGTIAQLDGDHPITGQNFIGFSAVEESGSFDVWDCEQCFYVMAVVRTYDAMGDYVSEKLACSNCFVKVCDPCFTTKMAYHNPSNAFGFYFNYADELFSQIVYDSFRFPAYIHSPTNPEEEKSYQKSDGSSVKLSHRIWKDYKFKTDYWGEIWQEDFTVITALDDIYLSNTYANVVNAKVIRIEKTEIDWKEDEIPLFAKAQMKGVLRLAAPRAYVNSNCE